MTLTPIQSDHDEPEEVARFVGREALERVERFERDSIVAKKQTASSKASSKPRVLELTWDDLEIGKLIGRGAFSDVRRATLRVDNGLIDHQVFAIKFLRPDIQAERKSFRDGAVDLALEAKMLMCLSHKNIISLVGIKGESLLEAFTREQGGFFLLEELLLETLDMRLFRWGKEERQRRGPLKGLLRNKNKSVPTITERLEAVALGIASGMEYLHENRVIYRDLKPGEKLARNKDHDDK
jgi:serine/threonine protein kinase